MKAKLVSKLTFSNIIIGFLILINILPVLAPILQNFGAGLPARIIYLIYSFMCHQIHWRSLHIYDHQCAWCSRDMAIWAAVLITVLIVKVFGIKGLKWYYILPFAIPIGLDGGIQTIASMVSADTNTPIYVSNNFVRAFTGAIFGIGLGSFIGNLIMEAENRQLKEKIFLFGRSIATQIPLVVITFLLVIAGYLGFVQIWRATSTDYLPSNYLDSAIKLPPEESFQINRRENGVCPATLGPAAAAEDQLRISCFIRGEN